MASFATTKVLILCFILPYLLARKAIDLKSNPPVHTPRLRSWDESICILDDDVDTICVDYDVEAVAGWEIE